MTEGTVIKVDEWRHDDWVKALREALRAKDDGKFGELLKLIAVYAPGLKGQACEMARGFGLENEKAQDGWEKWANDLFKTPEIQPIGVAKPKVAMHRERSLRLRLW